MKKLLTIIIASAVVSGCLKRGDELKHEKGIVVEKQYVPDSRQVVTGAGFSSSGSLVFTTHQIGESEKYLVIFACEHGIVFPINNPDCYVKLSKGDTVQIDYYEIINRSGEVVDYDFIDANKTTK